MAKMKIKIAVVLFALACLTVTAVYAGGQTHMVQMKAGDVAWLECDGGAAEMKVSPGMNNTLLIQCPPQGK